MAKREFLKEVYNTDAQSDIKSFYDEWSESYEEEVTGQGYITPKRCAEALAASVDDYSSPLLDFGCGTGISGEALAKAGFTEMDGCDLSDQMLDVARNKDIYRKLWVSDEASPVMFPKGTYRHITAVGVISVGAAPISLMDDLYHALPPGGTLTFSFNEHTLKEPQFEQRVYEYVDTAAVHLLFKEHGDHLPGISMTSTVYVMQKT